MAVYAGRNGLGDDDDEDVAIFIEEVDLESTGAPAQIQAITAAAESRDVDALRLALDNYHGSIDDPIEDGDPVLHLCCLYGHLPCVQLVVERGASLESKDAEGAIPLHDACAGGFTEIVQYIFNAAGSPETIKRMLEAVDVEGDTPLHNASRGEHVDVVNLLLSFGASPKKTNASGEVVYPSQEITGCCDTMETIIWCIVLSDFLHWCTPLPIHLIICYWMVHSQIYISLTILVHP